MGHDETILAMLAQIRPHGLCDDCLSNSLGITPRQQVNQKCRAMHGRGLVERAVDSCSSCAKLTKLVNTALARRA